MNCCPCTPLPTPTIQPSGLATTSVAAGPTRQCPDCNGRGWYVGECHPQEECVVCRGTGRVPTGEKPGP